MTFLIPDDIAEAFTDAVFRPGSRLSPARVEIVHMALVAAAPDLYAAWTPKSTPCPSRSCFGVRCELVDTHDGFHKGHLGSTPAAWDDGARPAMYLPLPESLATRVAQASKEQDQ